MHSVKTDYATTEACCRVKDSRLKSALCNEIVTPLINSLAFLGLPEKKKPVTKNVPAKIRISR